MKALLALEDGRVFEGLSFGVEGERSGEVVFHTGMTGYQETLSDPSYKGQIVTMTYPLIGNYGINDEDSESRGLWLEAFVIHELSRRASNRRSCKTLEEFLCEHNIMGIQGIDTRSLTKHIREKGALKAVVSTIDREPSSLVAKARQAPGLVGIDLVRKVTCSDPYEIAQKDSLKVVVLDFGVKTSIIRQLYKEGCSVVVVPAHTRYSEIVKLKPDGILLSNGPGDPAAVTYAVDTIQALLAMQHMPIFGICLGHQLLGLALGGKTFKLKFGHHGVNQPVKDLNTGKVIITVQNHGFCVDGTTLDTAAVEITHMNLNDHTLEGMRLKDRPVFSVQFHPEAGAGPHDARYLFKYFVYLMQIQKQRKGL